MKTYEQMAKDVLTRRDKFVQQRREHRRRAAVVSTAAGSFGLVMLLGYGGFRQLHKTPAPALSDSTVIGEQDVIPPEDLTEGEATTLPTHEKRPAATKPPIPTVDAILAINEMNKPQAALRLAKSTLDGWNEKRWTYDELTAYFGRDLCPATLPAGMQAETDLTQSTFRIFTDKKTGEIAHDLQQFSFYSGFYPENSEFAGAPIGAYDGGKEISITVTKAERFFRDYVYWFEDEEVKTSKIDGVEVVIGHRVSGSKYDENHNPTVTWDQYVATFRADGILYEVATDNLTVEELVTVIRNYV